MERSTPARSRGTVPAIVSAIVASGTAVVYVTVIVTQGDVDGGVTALVAAWLLGLAACAFVGAVRRTPDRVIPLGAATGGLLSAAVVSLFSIGALLLIAAICALLAWSRGGAGASRRDQLLAVLAAVAAAAGFLAIVLAI